MKKQKMKNFYPLSLDLAGKIIQAELTTSEFNLWLYFLRLDPFGDRYLDFPSALEIMSHLKISKPTYYRARARLQELNLFDFQEEKIKFRNLQGISKLKREAEYGENINDTEGKVHETEGKVHETEGKVHETEGKVHETEGKIHETEGKIHETEGKIHETEGKIHETRTPIEPSPDKGCGSPQISSDLNKTYKRSLSDPATHPAAKNERESFLDSNLIQDSQGEVEDRRSQSPVDRSKSKSKQNEIKNTPSSLRQKSTPIDKTKNEEQFSAARSINVVEEFLRFPKTIARLERSDLPEEEYRAFMEFAYKKCQKMTNPPIQFPDSWIFALFNELLYEYKRDRDIHKENAPTSDFKPPTRQYVTATEEDLKPPEPIDFNAVARRLGVDIAILDKLRADGRRTCRAGRIAECEAAVWAAAADCDREEEERKRQEEEAKKQAETTVDITAERVSEPKILPPVNLTKKDKKIDG